MNKIIQGDCTEVLKQLEENSVDSIVTDPPYELGFMGKSWDNTGIANDKNMWSECLRVLKPGGYLLSFGGTRTYHRMAVAIEDAGFEVRDMIEWCYGSGFPKSLNIGKAVDKLQGNEREEVEGGQVASTLGSNTMDGGKANPDYKYTKGTSEWEGWGTALKPAHEPICMARKPLGQQELDIAKNICYNIIEKGFITNSKIIWRIKNVKSAEKQKTKQSSTPTQQQKMVVVSAEFVETKENESVGKAIQKLIGSICDSGETTIPKKREQEVQNTTEQIKNEYCNTGKPINTSGSKTLSELMEENANVAATKDLSSLPLTISTEEEENTENKLKMEISMSSLKSTDTQKTDIDCSAQTATSQWVCMDIVRTIKVSFDGKEYDFMELSDGSLVWNETLEPYRKQQKLNVAENCLKYGTGGINIDESRVIAEPWIRKGHKSNVGFKLSESKIDLFESNGARFPANLIHDNSEEVRECFPETKSGSKPGQKGKSILGSENGETRQEIENAYGDSGNASRFFKSIIYTAKASKSERNRGCEGLEEKDRKEEWGDKFGAVDRRLETKNQSTGTFKNHHPTVKPIALMEYLIKMVTPKGGIVLDPFAGSGSTLVVAKQNGYGYIGIEKEPDYIKIAEARLGQIVQDTLL